MPTVGWIQEDAVERFLDARSSRKRQGPPPVWTCTKCGQTFLTLDSLRNHQSIHHPVSIPILVLKGEQVPREFVLRAPVSPADLEVLNATDARLKSDGGKWLPVDAAGLARKLALARTGTWEVELLNRVDEVRVEVREAFTLRVLIPDQSELDSIDQLFLDQLAVESLDQRALAAFHSQLPENAAAHEYGAALGNYALGVMMKTVGDHDRLVTSFDKYATKIGAAIEVLRHFDRPVAAAVVGCGQFILNDFGDRGHSLPPGVETGLGAFRAILRGDDSLSPTATCAKVATESPICPVDQVTKELLHASAALGLGSSDTRLWNAVNAIVDQPDTSELDRTKARVLSAARLIRISRATDAVHHLRALRSDPLFGEWAGRQLDTLDSAIAHG